MKRKLIRRNKIKVSNGIRLKKLNKVICRDERCITFDEISKVKARAQSCFKRRIARQNKLNHRQLKKLRKRQQQYGLCRSKFDGMCKVVLKPAAAVFKV